VTGKGEAGSTDAGGSQGVQAGSGNTQINVWVGHVPLTAESLGALSPHAAIARLRHMSHDEIVYLFATARPGSVSGVLRLMMETGEATAVAVLADISPRKVDELVAPLLGDSRWLEWLSAAATAIDRRAVAMGWAQAGSAERLHRVGSVGSGATGFARTYEQGQIYWTSRGGVCVLEGDIATYYAGRDGGLRLGCPTAGEFKPRSPFGTEGAGQEFEQGHVYSSGRGTYGIHSAILAKYLRLGGVSGWLGFPVAEAGAAGSGTMVTQAFEGGSIWVTKGNVYAVRPEMLVSAPRDCRPSSDEASVPASPYSTEGTSQEFEDSSGGRVIVYSSRNGSHAVCGHLLDYFLAAGAASSWLGFPVTDEMSFRCIGELAPVAMTPPPDTALGQSFEGGVVYWRQESAPVAVPKAFFEFISRNLGVADQLGFPVAEETSLGAEVGRIQLFENGNVTLLDHPVDGVLEEARIQLGSGEPGLLLTEKRFAVPSLTIVQLAAGQATVALEMHADFWTYYWRSALEPAEFARQVLRRRDMPTATVTIIDAEGGIQELPDVASARPLIDREGRRDTGSEWTLLRFDGPERSWAWQRVSAALAGDPGGGSATAYAGCASTANHAESFRLASDLLALSAVNGQVMLPHVHLLEQYVTRWGQESWKAQQQNHR
jgi:hypothetical protein